MLKEHATQTGVGLLEARANASGGRNAVSRADASVGSNTEQCDIGGSLDAETEMSEATEMLEDADAQEENDSLPWQR